MTARGPLRRRRNDVFVEVEAEDRPALRLLVEGEGVRRRWSNDAVPLLVRLDAEAWRPTRAQAERTVDEVVEGVVTIDSRLTRRRMTARREALRAWWRKVTRGRRALERATGRRLA